MDSHTVGGGVNIQALDQIRDAFVDREFRRENCDLGMWSTRSNEIEYIEALLNETKDNSISDSLKDFFNSINELSKDTVNKEIRTNVQQNAIKLCETINHFYNQFVDLQKVHNDSMKVTAMQINDLLTNISEYNKEIYSYELSGDKANDLRDKRNVMLDDLSKLVNIEYKEDSSGHLSVSVEGQVLVDHTTVSKIEAVADQTGAVSGEAGFYSIYLEGTTTPFKYSSGQLEGYRKLRDGNSTDDIGIPRILENLNTLARSLAKEFNTINSAGYTIPHDGTPSKTGVNLFDVPAGGYADITGKNFKISKELKDSVYNIAASDKFIDVGASNDLKGNNKNVLKMVELISRVDVPVVSNFEDFLKSTIVEVAIDSSHSKKMEESQNAVMSNLENRRQSISGVSVDEEMVEMVKYQHSYAAASRMINTIDEAIDIIINRTGMVGR
jgi:flagellar hook-associated protein 1 FlgK